MWEVVIKKLQQLHKLFSELKQTTAYTPTYRLVEINQTDNEDHSVVVQIINKSIVFEIKPEEILANDKLVDQFSPRDIRTLTYLGYLSLNNPKYKILAQKLSEHDKVLFALRKKGEKKVVIKTAAEILQEKSILHNLTAQDAQIIGYTVASESMMTEKKMKEDLKKSLNKT